MAKIIGGKKLLRHLAVRSKGVDVTPTLIRAADRTRTEYIDRVNEPSPGTPQVRYSKGREPRTVIASAPGAAPNSDLGGLIGSAATSSDRRNHAEMSVEADYAAALELGTPNMAPRPALGPAFDELKPHILKNIAKALKDG